MIVALAGAHGKIAMRLTALLSRAGDEVIGLIRNPDHAADVQCQGGLSRPLRSGAGVCGGDHRGDHWS